MKLRYKYFYFAFILSLILSGTIFAQNYPTITRIESYSGYIRVFLDWGSAPGKEIYEVYRSNGGYETYTSIGTVEQGSAYFDDKKDLYKTADQFFSYQIIGPQGKSNIGTVRYRNASSTAKRTWGSIKAMFR